jgi:putative hemolysin
MARESATISDRQRIATSGGSYSAEITDDPATIRRAQRLRYRVFAEEMGAQLSSGAATSGTDVDEFDELCDHLVVTYTPTGEIVGTYRVLPPQRSPRLYSESEFAIDGLADLRPRLIEAGRSCVHPEHRAGVVINLMWSVLARYMLLSGHQFLSGCASVPLADGGNAAATMLALAPRHAAPERWTVEPRTPWLGTPATRPSYAHLPPLLRGYLRLGAWVCVARSRRGIRCRGLLRAAGNESHRPALSEIFPR